MGDAVVVDGLTKRYGGLVAVDGLSFRVPEGSVFALLGANGAGKTTTLECIEGFRQPDGGRIRVLDLDPVRDRAALVPDLGVMLQGGGAWQAASAREMLRLYAAFYADPLDPDALLERVGLAGRASSRARTLSGGERQRLHLALALVGRPRIAILDEPTASMDVRARRLVWQVIEELRGEGVTVLLSTHLTDEVERLANTVAVIHRGRLAALDSPAGLVARMRGGGVRVQTPGPLDPDALAAAVGAHVEPAGPGQWLVDAGAEAIPRITAWFDTEGLPLAGVRAADLDDVILRLTGEDAG